jgi:hypothetical protein
MADRGTFSWMKDLVEVLIYGQVLSRGAAAPAQPAAPAAAGGKLSFFSSILEYLKETFHPLSRDDEQGYARMIARHLSDSERANVKQFFLVYEQEGFDAKQLKIDIWKIYLDEKEAKERGGNMAIKLLKGLSLRHGNFDRQREYLDEHEIIKVRSAVKNAVRHVDKNKKDMTIDAMLFIASCILLVIGLIIWVI